MEACVRKITGATANPPSVRRICKWRAHEDEIRSLTTFRRHGKTLLLSAADDRQVLVWSLDGTLLGNLAQGRPEFAQEGVPGRRIYPFLVDDPPAEAWSKFAAYDSVGTVECPLNPCPAEALEATALFGSGNTSFNAATIRSPEDVNQRAVADASSTIFLTETVVNSSSFATTPKPPALRLPAQFLGVLDKDRALAGGRGLRAKDHRKPLMHSALPPIRGSTPPDEKGTTVHSARSQGSRPPQSLPTPVSPREYVRLGIVPTASACSAPRLTPRAPTFDPKAKEGLAGRRARAPMPSDGANPLGAMTTSAREYLRAQGFADDPFESKKDRCLRLGGSVVVGHTESGKSVTAHSGETSNRVK